MGTNITNDNKDDSNQKSDGWLSRARLWPQRKKLNFIFTITGAIIFVLLIIWLIIGNYKPNDGNSAQSTINGIINSIKHP
jgi:hypothetical protein